MRRIVLTGGGTAGHVTPHLAILPELIAQGWEIHYIGTAAGIERTLMDGRDGVTYHAISSGKLRRYIDLKNLSDPFRVAWGIGQARRLIHKLKPDVLFSKGGFVAVPAVLGAKLNRVPVVLHESDLTPGLANRICLPYATHILTAFEETAKSLGDKASWCGTPVRAELLNGSRIMGLKRAKLSGRKPVVLIMGGSSGARAINDVVAGCLDTLLKKYEIIHLCGKDGLSEDVRGRTGYCALEYANEEMGDLMAAADIVVSRAGANSLFELLALNKPNLLIPLPLSASRGDQIQNAQSFKERGFSMVLEQEILSADTLLSALDTLYAQRERYRFKMLEGAKTVNGTQNALTAIAKYALSR